MRSIYFKNDKEGLTLLNRIWDEFRNLEEYRSKIIEIDFKLGSKNKEIIGEIVFQGKQ